MRNRLMLVGVVGLLLAVLGACMYVSNFRPVARFSALPATGVTPLEVTLDAALSEDEDGTIVAYLWNFGDGQTSSRSVFPFIHEFTVQSEAQTFAVVLTVVDDQGGTDTAVHYVKVNP